MKTLAFLVVFALSGIAFAEEPAPVKVYCFSADLEAGFKDSGAAFFCKELGKSGKKKKSLEIANKRSAATVVVQYLGKDAIEARGEATYLLGGYAWTPNQFTNGVRAVISIGKYTKGFHGEGVNDFAAYSVWTEIESWIRENREVILQKAREK